MKIRPILHYVLVGPDKVEEVTKGGIVIPQQTKDRDQYAAFTGVVKAIGPNAWEDWEGGPQVKVGDRVAFAQYSGVRVDRNEDGESWLMFDKDIHGVIEDD